MGRGAPDGDLGSWPCQSRHVGQLCPESTGILLQKQLSQEKGELFREASGNTHLLTSVLRWESCKQGVSVFAHWGCSGQLPLALRAPVPRTSVPDR